MALQQYTNSQAALVAIIAGISIYADGTKSAGNIFVNYNKTLDDIIADQGLGDEVVVLSFDSFGLETMENSNDVTVAESYTIFMKTISPDPATKDYAIVNQILGNSEFNQTNLDSSFRKITISGGSPIAQVGAAHFVTISISIN